VVIDDKSWQPWYNYYIYIYIYIYIHICPVMLSNAFIVAPRVNYVLGPCAHIQCTPCILTFDWRQ